MRKSLLLFLTVLVPFLLSAQQQVAKKITAANGQTIGFYEFTPSDYGTQKHPLIIFLHGIAERGNGTTELSLITKVAIPKYLKNGRTMRFYVDGKWQSFVVLSPQLSKSYGGWQHFYVDEMIKYAVNNLKVDPNKITLTGLSLGGGGTWSYASASSTNASKLAAIVPVCGTCGLSSAANIVNNKVAVYAFHGDADTRVSPSCSKNAINAINKLNPEKDALLKLYAKTTTHVIWDRAYDTAYAWQKPNVWEWILRQSRGTTTPVPQPIPLPNVPPVAKAGADQTITLPTNSVTLNGSASTDADGSISSYAWSKVSGPATFSIAKPTAVSTSVTNLVEGIYTFRLTVKDNAGASATNDVVITVNKGTSTTQKPVADIEGLSSITLPTNSVDLSASGSSSPNGNIVMYYWEKISGPSTYGISGPNNRLSKVHSLVQGTYVIRLTVTDAKGATAYTDHTITVNGKSTSDPIPSNVKAVISGPSQISLPNNSVDLSGSDSYSSDGSISKYRWEKVSGPSSISITGPNNRLTSITSLVQGTYVIRLTVTDSKYATASTDHTITVGGVSTQEPTPSVVKAVITGTSQISLPTNSVGLSGSNSYSPNGSISRYRWEKVSGPSSFSISGPNNRLTTVSSLVQGTYVIRLTVTDSKGASGYTDFSITVNGSSTVEKSTSTASAVITGPSSTSTGDVLLDGSSSSSSAGSIASYRWSKVSGPSAYVILGPNNRKTEIAGLSAGTYVFRLVVTDSKGASDQTDKTVTVSGTASTATISTQSVMESTPVQQSIVVKESLSVYPNPAISTINIQGSSVHTGSGFVNIYDINGKMVKKTNFVKTQSVLQQSMDISSLPAGVYQMEMIIGSNPRILSRFVKQ